MPDIDDVLNHPITASAAGSFVALLFARKMTWLQAVLSWPAGIACAHYGTPLLLKVSDLAAGSPLASAFLVGAFGLQFVAIVYDLILVLRENPKATIAEAVEILAKLKGLRP